MTRYPDTRIGSFDPPPRTFTDGEGRDITVREHTGDDEDGDPAFEALVEMYLDFDPADRAQGIPPSREVDIRQWLENILAPACENVVATHEDADDDTGHATLVPDGEGGHELAIFVLHEYQNAGIGTRLMETLLGLGQREGVERVWLTVERWNDPAIALYRKIGFETSGEGGVEMEMGARL